MWRSKQEVPLPGGTALITGASAGIGQAYAEGLAARGCDLVLVARRRDRLTDLASRVSQAHGVRCEVLTVDLAEADATAAIVAELDRLGITVDVLVNNAGFATYGRIDTIAAEEDREQVLVNSLAVVDLCHALIPGMIERGHGLVLNLSSIGGFQPAPFMAVYAATKAFNLHFTEALWRETRGTGVRVMAVCPGSTATEFFDVVGNETETRFGRLMPASSVVDASLHALHKDRPSVVIGTFNTAVTRLPRFLPRRAVLALVARQTSPREMTRTKSRDEVA